MTYQIQGFQSNDTQNGCDAERTAETIKEARLEAKYMLSDDYRRACEASRKLVTIQIWKGETLVAELGG